MPGYVSMGSTGREPQQVDLMAEKLLDRMRPIIRVRHYSIRTEKAYLHWVRRFILFHGKRHPETMGAEEVTAFLSHLATERDCAASTQNQALNAILFLYRHVLEIGLPWRSGRSGCRSCCPCPRSGLFLPSFSRPTI